MCAYFIFICVCEDIQSSIGLSKRELRDLFLPFHLVNVDEVSRYIRVYKILFLCLPRYTVFQYTDYVASC